MDLKTMTDLVYIYEGMEDLEEIMERLSGVSMFMYEEGPLGMISHVYDALRRNTAFYNPDNEEWEEEIDRILDDDSIDEEEKARRLLAG